MSQRRQRRERPHGLVVTEGKVTEIQYLEQLRQVLPRTAVTFTACGDGTDPLRVVKRAVGANTCGPNPSTALPALLDLLQS